jgi:hypothetical protein
MWFFCVCVIYIFVSSGLGLRAAVRGHRAEDTVATASKVHNPDAYFMLQQVSLQTSSRSGPLTGLFMTIRVYIPVVMRQAKIGNVWVS